MNEYTKNLFKSKCDKDYFNNHDWESIGITGTRPIYQVFKCSQCKKIVTETLIPLQNAEPSFSESM